MDDRNMVLTRAPYDPYVESIVADGDYTLVITFKNPMRLGYPAFSIMSSPSTSSPL